MNMYKKVVSLCFISVFLLPMMFNVVDYAFVADEHTESYAEKAIILLWNFTFTPNIFAMKIVKHAFGNGDGLLVAAGGKLELYNMDSGILVHTKDASVSGLAVGDVNKDGIDEIFYQSQDSVFVIDHNFNSLWSAYFGISASSHSNPDTSISVGDMNGDGYCEVGSGGYRDGFLLNGTNGNVIWSLHDVLNWQMGGFGNEVVSSKIADVNNDGQNELIVGSDITSIAVFNYTRDCLWNSDINEQGGYGIYNILVGDVNDDERDEVIISCYGTMTIINGTNGVRLWTRGFSEHIHSGLSLGDVNNDGVLDIGIGDDRGIHVYDGFGNLLWTKETREKVYSTAVGDINTDGKNEVAVGAEMLYILNSSGREIGRFPTTREVQRVIMDGNRTILASKDGHGYVITIGFPFKCSTILLYTLADGSPEKDLIFVESGNKTEFIKLPKNSSVVSAELDLEGPPYIIRVKDISDYVGSTSFGLWSNASINSSPTDFWIANNTALLHFNSTIDLVEVIPLPVDSFYYQGWYAHVRGLWSNATGVPPKYFWILYGNNNNQGINLITASGEYISSSAVDKSYFKGLTSNASNITPTDWWGVRSVYETGPIQPYYHLNSSLQIVESYVTGSQRPECIYTNARNGEPTDFYVGSGYAPIALLHINRTGYVFETFSFTKNAIVGIYTNETGPSPKHLWVLDSCGLMYYMQMWEYPYNPYLDVGCSDYPWEWFYVGEFNESVSPQTANLNKTLIQNYLDSSTPDAEGNVLVPLFFHIDSAGILRISRIRIFYKETVATHNIVVTNLTSSKTVVGQGYCTNISVTVENQGDYTETFNVSVFYDDTIITLPDGKNHTTTTLTSGNSRTITFSWNTTGFAKGNYTIWAYAWPVQNETDEEDNTLINGVVLVSIAGDVNGDRLVDVADLVMTVGAVPSTPTINPEMWNPNADINGDGVCDIGDLVICVGNIPSSW